MSTPGSIGCCPVTPLPSGATQTISGDLLADFIPGTGSIAVSASPFGALDAPALLQALDRYPYGCSEQTVSRAMPLLYANRLASLENLGVDPDLDGRVRQDSSEFFPTLKNGRRGGSERRDWCQVGTRPPAA